MIVNLDGTNNFQFSAAEDHRSSGFEVFVGTKYDDKVSGDDVSTTIKGGKGEDGLFGGTADDKLFGGADDDLVYGGLGNDRLVGGGGDDNLQGFRDDNQLFGGKGDDLLFGGTGNSTLNGGKGNDTLFAGDGEEVMVGGKGADLFLFTQVGWGESTIKDINAKQGDEIQLNNVVADFAELEDSIREVGSDLHLELDFGTIVLADMTEESLDYSIFSLLTFG